MKKILIIVACCTVLFACSNKKDDKKTEDGKTTSTTTDGKQEDAVLLPLSEADPVVNSQAAFAKGDVDGMTSYYDDNILYTWSGGDSLRGKQAVKDYYTGRWKLIESLEFSNPIKLPLQVNVSQQPAAAPPGKWILYWSFATVKYKNGKELKMWMHSVNHMNDAGKIDFIGQYLDRHPIMEATKDLMPK